MPLGRTDRRLRALALLLVFVLFGGAAGLKLGHLQVVAGPELRARLEQRGAAIEEEAPVRGDIVDRNGVVLARTAWVDLLSASPRYIPERDRQPVADELAAILGYDEEERAELARTLAGDAGYVVLDRGVDPAVGEAIRAAKADGGLQGIALEPRQVRVYPNPGGEPDTTLASQLIGFVTADGRGRYGVEQRYDEALSGRGGMLASVTLPGGAGLPPVDTVGGEVAGATIQLTIDAGLQLELEKQLYHALVMDKAQRVSGVVLDPETGEVLAWASVPGYDANDFGRVWERDPSLLADPIASGVYEPGSVMKIFTAAAALSNGTVTPRTRVVDGEVLRLNEREVRNANHLSMGSMRFEDAIAWSRNVATAKVALRLGSTSRRSATRLFRTWQAFGLGKSTGIDIAGEARGIVPDPRKRPWSDLDIANRSFGQGVATTQVQLAAAFAAMVNGGLRVRPHLLVADTLPDEKRQRAIEPKVAAQLRHMLYHVTASVPHYAEGSLIRGYEVGGKTGTAEIWDQKQGRYLPRTFNFSFVGYVGGDEPEAIVSVRIHHTKPKVRGQGDLELEISSYELFRRVALDVIRTFGIRRSKEPGAGFPEPRSIAERLLTPDRYQASLRQSSAEARASARREGGGDPPSDDGAAARRGETRTSPAGEPAEDQASTRDGDSA